MLKKFSEIFKSMVEDGDAPTNNTGGVENKDTPLAMHKRKKDKENLTEVKFSEILEQQEDECGYETGILAGCMQFKVSHDQYEKLKRGREKYSRWNQFVDDDRLQRAISKELYKNGKVIMTNTLTGASVYVNHIYQQRDLDGNSGGADMDLDESLIITQPIV